MLARAVEVAGMANSKPDEMGNTLYYGDCLEVMEKFLADESIDLIYLDPPFNSNADYNIIFGKQRNGKPAQVTAFGDTWRWGGRGTEDAVLIAGALKHPAHVAVSAFMTLLGECGMMAYLGYMAQRLVVMHSKLKDTGTLYLHCDTTASHYLKVLLDSVFGPQNYLNEISWLRSQPKSHAKVNLSRCRDLILRYGKGPNTVFNKVYGEYDPDYVMKFYRHTDEDGRRYQLADLTNPNPARPNLTYEFMGVHRVWRWTRERMEEARQEGRIVQSKPGAVPRYKRYLDEMRGQPVTDNWDDIEHLHGSNKEKLPYPTQKPVALLERILDLSSNPGDLVLDPFCGCGTTIVAAEKLSRRWVGIDISPVAIDVMTRERRDFPVGNFQIKGVPEDLAGAGKLAESNPYDFQRWAIPAFRAWPQTSGCRQMAALTAKGFTRMAKRSALCWRKSNPAQRACRRRSAATSRRRCGSRTPKWACSSRCTAIPPRRNGARSTAKSSFRVALLRIPNSRSGAWRISLRATFRACPVCLISSPARWCRRRSFSPAPARHHRQLVRNPNTTSSAICCPARNWMKRIALYSMMRLTRVNRELFA